jgi:hypothetical protein
VSVGDQLLRDDVCSRRVRDLRSLFYDGTRTTSSTTTDRGIAGDNFSERPGRAEQVRVNLVTRTRMEDREWTQGRTQAMENRAAGGANDGFRRRTYTSTVMLRNVGARSL